MFFRMIAEMRIDGPATGGTASEYPLQPSGGGRMVKDAGYMVKIVARSHAAAMCGVKLHHGPDATLNVLHSTPIANATVPGLPGLLAGDTTGTAAMIGDYLDPILTCTSLPSQPALRGRSPNPRNYPTVPTPTPIPTPTPTPRRIRCSWSTT